MTMQRRHYELIAEAVAEVLRNADYPKPSASASWRGVESTAYALARKLRATNPKFNEARFLRACGVED